jgi:hypothetical protein
MNRKQKRSHTMILCLLAGLLPAGAAPQRTPDVQLPRLAGWHFRAEGWASVLTFGERSGVEPSRVGAARGELPWFHKSYDLTRADVTRPMTPAEVVLPEPEKLELPGTVQNLRILSRP